MAEQARSVFEVAEELERESGCKISPYQSFLVTPKGITDEDCIKMLEAAAEEVDISEFLDRCDQGNRPNGVLILCLFKSDQDQEGRGRCRLFEMTPAYSAIWRKGTATKASNSFGELFAHLLQ